VSGGVRVLIVSSFPPRHCGIGVYARAQADALRTQGHQVTVLSPPDGDGDQRAPFLGGRAFLRAARVGGRFDRVVVHFQPALFYRPRRPMSKVLTSTAFLALALRRGGILEIVVHEADPPRRWRPDYALLRQVFPLARQVSFHTSAEWRGFRKAYRLQGRTLRARLVPHLAAPAAARPSRERARRSLKIPAEGSVFVCAGFLQPSKGFDRAVEAFARAFPAGSGRADRNGNATRGRGSRPPASLYLVGSIREETAENLAYVERLRARCAQVPGVRLVEGFVADDGFDLWLAAADRVVLPYRRSWSSGVLARAQALGTPAVVTAEGGLAEQAGKDDVVVRDDDELIEALRRAAAPARIPR
jgi:glycosyltransferase involved in cell wall biosynthesis